MIRLRRGFAIVFAAGTVLAACGGGSDSANTPTDTPALTDPVATDAPAEETDAGDPICAAIVEEGEYEPIGCDEPHDAELAGFVSTTAEASSDDDAEFEIELMRLCADAVSALTSRPSILFGVDVGPVYDPEAESENNVECWATVSTPAALVGSLTVVDLEDAIGDYTLIVAMDPGTCYLEPDEGYDLGTIVDCDEPAAQQVVSSITSRLDDYDDDAITEDGFARCEEEIADAPFELIGTTYSMISPLESGWKALDRRTLICLMQHDDDVTTEPEAPQASAEEPCAGSSDDFYPALPCDEPHHAEFAGAVAPPVDVLPEDSAEAETIGISACRDTVLQFAGVDRLPLGVGVGFVVNSNLGEPIEDDLLCFVSTDLSDGFFGSIAEIGFDAALQKIVVPELAPGSCFSLGESNFYLAEPADCADADALMFVGNFDLDDGPYPGADPIRDIRAVECARLLDESGLAADPTSVSGTFPGEGDWRNLGQRTVACDASPL